MPMVRFPLTASEFITLVNILSINVVELAVILVGIEIAGESRLLDNSSKKFDASESEFIFKRFIFKSPVKKTFLLFSSCSLFTKGDI